MRKMTSAELRRKNISSIYNFIYRSGGATRQEIQQQLQLSLPTIAQDLRFNGTLQSSDFTLDEKDMVSSRVSPFDIRATPIKSPWPARPDCGGCNGPVYRLEIPAVKRQAARPRLP